MSLLPSEDTPGELSNVGSEAIISHFQCKNMLLLCFPSPLLLETQANKAFDGP